MEPAQHLSTATLICQPTGFSGFGACRQGKMHTLTRRSRHLSQALSVDVPSAISGAKQSNCGR